MSVVDFRPGPNVDEINRELKGFTELRDFQLAWDPARSHYILKLSLANAEERTKALTFRDVQNLELNPAGEDFQQLLLLRIEDVRADGLDRIRFTVDELEHGTLFLHCADLELSHI